MANVPRVRFTLHTPLGSPYSTATICIEDRCHQLSYTELLQLEDAVHTARHKMGLEGQKAVFDH